MIYWFTTKRSKNRNHLYSLETKISPHNTYKGVRLNGLKDVGALLTFLPSYTSFVLPIVNSREFIHSLFIPIVL